MQKLPIGFRYAPFRHYKCSVPLLLLMASSSISTVPARWLRRHLAAGQASPRCVNEMTKEPSLPSGPPRHCMHTLDRPVLDRVLGGLC